MNHCSNCGERIVGEQQFCRSCGAELFAEARRSGFDPRNLIYVGLFSTLVGALVVMTGKFVDSKVISFAGVVFAIVSFGVMLVGAILSETPRRKRKSAAPAADAQYRPPDLEKANTTNQLPPIAADAHFPASVTEQTTTKLRVR
ncbi:MAG: zinc-ribbon domain-containing protein [Pyrinomonadaceae bacterium]